MAIINAHTHLELSDAGHLLPEPSAEFTAWIQTVIGHNSQRSPEEVRAACEAGVAALLAAGTTHVGDISFSGLSVEPLVRSGLEGVVWIEVIGTHLERGLLRLEAVKRQIDELRELAAASPIRIGVTLHAPYSLHPELWEPALRWIEEAELPLCIHAAESPGEWELLMQGTGPFRELQARFELPPFPAPGCTPIAYLARLGVLDFRPLLVHMVQVDDEDIRLVQQSGAIIVHCPRSNERLKCGRMPLERYLESGIPCLLGTDSLGSSPSLDVREEGEHARAWHAGAVPPERIDAMLQDAGTFEAHYGG